MAQLSDDCFAFGGELTELDVALADLDRRLVAVVETEIVPLPKALGRILAEPVVAGHTVPPRDNSAVDGYAIWFDDLVAGQPTRLPVVGRAAAGHPFTGTACRGQALRIFTGAVMPPGPDTVMMQEDCTVEGDTVIVRPGIKRGANRRLAGEDFSAGATLIPAGRRLRALEIGLAAAAGRTTLTVFRPLRVAVLSTGDEVREPGTALPEGGIYDSNRYLVMALLTRLGCQILDLGIMPDRADVIADRLARGAQGQDLVISTGGVSTGDEDHVKAALGRLGTLHFWRLGIKPGRPLAIGQIGTVPFLGLPGNPVAAVITFLFFARPMLQRLGGATPSKPVALPVRANFSYRKKPRRREWMRVTLSPGADGIPVATKFPRDGAGVLTSVVDGDGLVELDETTTQVEPGTLVRYLPLRGWDD